MSTRTASLGPGTTLYGTCLISCATSEYLRPMKRLIEKTVCSGFSAACRFATWPTSLSPVLVNATTDGVMRPPSLLTITVGLSPSMVATAELVVPRSIPIAFAMTFYSFVPGSFARRCAVVALPYRKQFKPHELHLQRGVRLQQ